MFQRVLLLLPALAVLLTSALCPLAFPWVDAAWAATPKKGAQPAAKPAPPPPAQPEKPDRKTPPAFDMKAYMDTHKQLVQTLAEAKAFMEQDKQSAPDRAGMANYFLGEIDRAKLQAENSFDLVFLYFDHFLKADAVSNILAGYVGNRIRHLSHGMDDLATELGANISKSPYAQDARFANLHARLTSYQLLLTDLAQRIIPVQ